MPGAFSNQLANFCDFTLRLRDSRELLSDHSRSELRSCQVLAEPIVKVLTDTSLLSAKDLQDLLLQAAPLGDIAISFENNRCRAAAGYKLKPRRNDDRPPSLGRSMQLSFPKSSLV